MRKCLQCQDELPADRRGIYCSPSCNKRHFYLKTRPARLALWYNRTCEHCGVAFVTQDGRRSKFCTPECLDAEWADRSRSKLSALEKVWPLPCEDCRKPIDRPVPGRGRAPTRCRACALERRRATFRKANKTRRRSER